MGAAVEKYRDELLLKIRRLEYHNASLIDAIGALRDFVEGRRSDTENITEILNGALCLSNAKVS